MVEVVHGAAEKLPLLWQAGIPGGLAALLQLGMALAIGKLPPVTQIIGTLIVAGLVGGGVSVVSVEVFHTSGVIGGIVGGATGAVPAPFWAQIARKAAAAQAKQRFGVDAEDESSAEVKHDPS